MVMDDPVMLRLVLEFMPLSFSRRHGDPSRPWNKFNIQLKDDNGNKIKHYEGNWRDIFQNWEALGLSFPCYYENMVAKFVNASTIDGFNPYRIDDEGIDWERPEPDNPFSGLGYWGDHQIIYLLRLLQGLNNHFPDRLKQLLEMDIFSYANIPYKILPYEEILKDSKRTIEFDREMDKQITKICNEMGTDGKLVLKNSEVYSVTLVEKLLVPLLSKICNLYPGGGIWMNTQRPEWNDANNAIVGIGLSMVTVYHLKTYISFMQELFATQKNDYSYSISNEIVDLAKNISNLLSKYNRYDGKELEILDSLGEIFSEYRFKVYEEGFSEKTEILTKEITSLLSECNDIIDYTIKKNSGTVYSTYNLIDENRSVKNLQPMLEGQSAVIGSKILSTNEVSQLIDGMSEQLLNKDMNCHYLYPLKMTTPFMQKNIITGLSDPLPNIIIEDEKGQLHFSPNITSEAELENIMNEMQIDTNQKQNIIAEFENVFKHKSFTGRSGVMYKFEGIGCVYWHQNAKFALAVLESIQKVREKGGNVEELYEKYRNILSGFIFSKTPEQCGVIPIEPYSHTSFNQTTEQPGMTGQVKESLLMRRGELGLKIKDGTIYFDPWYISEKEFDENGLFNFTLCGTKVKYIRSDKNTLEIKFLDGSVQMLDELKISNNISKDIFMRNGNVKEIILSINKNYN